MKHEAQFRFRSEKAREIFRAVSPETAAEVNPRSRAECRYEEPDTLVLKVSAADVGALRASLNMWLRLVSVAQEMQDLIIDQERTA
jgi:KEOPS complex subunit Pcc1